MKTGKEIILLIILNLLLAVCNASAQLPPPPPASEISVTDSAPPSNDLNIPYDPLTVGTSITQTVTITNEGNSDLNIGTVASIDPIAFPFSLIDDNCSDQAIIPFSSCTLVIGFSPISEGQFADTFDIPSNDGDENPATINLSGTGLSPVNNNPPSVPQLIYPADGQTGLGTSVEFRWVRCVDPEQNTVSYSLYISEDPEFIDASPILVSSLGRSGFYYACTGTGMLLFGIVLTGFKGNKRRAVTLIIIMMVVQMLSFSCGGGSGGSSSVGGAEDPPISSNEVSKKVSGLITGTTYYWKVAADDGNGGIVESKKRSFIIH